MRLENEFRVDVPVEEAWRVLLDVERIAPCMPGAQLQEVEGDEYRGIVKVKVGPITAQYKGVARITESDDTNHRAVIRAEGRDTRGQGNASATATAALQPDGDGTRVSIDSDVTITGKVAQFGRGVIADVSAKLLDQFVACLERDVLSSGGNPPASNEVAESGKARTIEAPEAEPVDLLRTAGAPVLKRVVPVAAAVVVVIVVVLILLLR
jgi:carbon monoxide dehydrogenase subunit G